MLRTFFSAVAAAALLFAAAQDVEAGPRKKKRRPKGQVVEMSQLFEVSVQLGKGRRAKEVKVYCLNKTPGQVKEKRGTLRFTPFKKLAANAQGKKATRFRKLQKAGAKQCKDPGFGSLARYTGPFGEREARLLYDRFAFGPKPGDIERAVAEGLGRTVDRLLAVLPEPALDAHEEDLRCDGRELTDENNKSCNPNNPNDLSLAGYRYGLYARALNGLNPLHERLFIFLHNSRLAVSTEVLPACANHAVRGYVQLVRNAAYSGDYKHYMREWNNDLLGHYIWLDGGSNHAGILNMPNENYAREFWELGTTGPSDLDGQPVYNDRDIAQAALAFTGGNISRIEVGREQVCVRNFSTDLHASGPKTVFGGTRYERTVYNADDMLEATFAHPRTAEHLAEDLWREYIAPTYPKPVIQNLAKRIRAHQYNLHAVLRELMMSSALFDAQNRGALIKDPYELLMGFLRATQIPLTYAEIDSALNSLGMRPLLAPTVFGWDPQRLASEAFVLEWRNVVLSILTRSASTYENRNFNFHSQFLQGLPTNTTPSLAAIDRFARRLGLSLTAEQVATLDQYMNWDRVRCNGSRCGGASHELRRSVYDPHPGNPNHETKTRGALAILAMLDQYRVK